MSERNGLSISPLKPKILLNRLMELKLMENFSLEDGFLPFNDEDFFIAHNEEYVEKFFLGDPNYTKLNGFRWSREFAETIRYTNSSLYNAQRYSILNPNCITFSPSSGFHQATPYGGMYYCTFSGQVISAIKLYNEMGIKTAWIDMDGHLGNSIEESRDFVKDLNSAIPKGLNINPGMYGDKSYLEDLKEKLHILEEEILKENVNSICFAQGADSHEWDDLAPSDTRLSTVDWIYAHRMVFEKILEISRKRDKPVPLMISLFGGHRENDPNSIIHLHIMTLLSALEILSGIKSKYKLEEEIKEKKIYLKK